MPRAPIPVPKGLKRITLPPPPPPRKKESVREEVIKIIIEDVCKFCEFGPICDDTCKGMFIA